MTEQEQNIMQESIGPQNAQPAISMPIIEYNSSLATGSVDRVTKKRDGTIKSTPRFDDMGNRVGDDNG